MNVETWSNTFTPTSRRQFFNGKLHDTCPHPREIKKDILSRDRDLRLAQYEGRADMSTVVEVERAIGWPRLWDLALDHGPKCIDGLRNLVRVITFPPHALSACSATDGGGNRGSLPRAPRVRGPQTLQESFK